MYLQNKTKVTVGDFNSPFSIIGTRRQKINKKTENLNNKVNHQNVTNFYRTTTAEHLLKGMWNILQGGPNVRP